MHIKHFCLLSSLDLNSQYKSNMSPSGAVFTKKCLIIIWSCFAFVFSPLVICSLINTLKVIFFILFLEERLLELSLSSLTNPLHLETVFVNTEIKIRHGMGYMAFLCVIILPYVDDTNTERSPIWKAENTRVYLYNDTCIYLYTHMYSIKKFGAYGLWAWCPLSFRGVWTAPYLERMSFSLWRTESFLLF